jgi:hypothetical protein
LLATVSRHRDKTALTGLLVVFALLSLVLVTLPDRKAPT